MRTIPLCMIMLFTSLTTWSQPMCEDLRSESRQFAARGYFNKSIECLRQIPVDSLCLDDMQQFYDNFCSLNNQDSIFYWGDRIVEYDPYCMAVIPDFTLRLNQIKSDGRPVFPDRVIEICKKYQQRDSTHILVNRQLAEAYYNMGNYDLALPELKRLEALGDTCFGTLYTLGLTYRRMGDNSAAYDYLYRAYEKNDHHPYCLFVLGIVCNRIGFGAEALSYLDAALELLMPDRHTLFRLHEELAEAFNQKDEMDFRLEELKKCMEYAEETNVNELTYQMGMCYYSMHQFDKTRELLNKFLDATVNKEYNDKIKSQRDQAFRALQMMDM